MKIIPEIRFPEFQNEGQWDEKKISELGDTINGLTGKSGNDFGKGSPYVTYKQVFNDSIIDFEKCGKVQISSNEDQNTLQKGDILFTTSSETPHEVGFASVLISGPKEPTYLNSFCFSLRPFNIEEIQPIFYRYLFHSPSYRKSVTKIAQGSTRYNLSKGAFLNLKVFVPKPLEQEKIASCLSSLDEVISAHAQKLEHLKDHKKGLMQNLFPQEGEKVPKWRFKEFEGDGEWVEQRFEQLFQIGNGRDYKHLKTGTVPVYGSGGYMLSVDDFLYEGESVCIGRKGTIDKPFFLTGKFWTVDTLFYTHSFKNCSPKYIYYVFEQIKWREHNEAGGVPSLTKNNIYNIAITIPMTLAEQQKIASCLSSIDTLITAEGKKIAQLKLHKLGLMQGLFPRIES
jgi:type I restriction enzyme S subunit